jgi:hypothetical protein
VKCLREVSSSHQMGRVVVVDSAKTIVCSRHHDKSATSPWGTFLHPVGVILVGDAFGSALGYKLSLALGQVPGEALGTPLGAALHLH